MGVISSILFYMMSSLGCIFTNKYLLNSSSEKADAIFVAWFQNFFEFLVILLLTSIDCCSERFRFFPPLLYVKKDALKIMPSVIFFVSTILLNNKCMESISLTSYQIARSLTIIFNVIFTYLVLRVKTSLAAILACVGVVVGFIVGLEGEIQLSVKGTVYGILSSIALAMYSVTSKKSMDMLNGNQFILIEYIIPFSLLILTPMVAIRGGFDVFFERHSLKFWIAQVVGSVFGTLINIASFVCIKHTSPLTFNMVGTLNSCLTSTIAYVFFKGENFTITKAAGNVTIIIFTFIYSCAKRQENNKQEEANEQEKSTNDEFDS